MHIRGWTYATLATVYIILNLRHNKITNNLVFCLFKFKGVIEATKQMKQMEAELKCVQKKVFEIQNRKRQKQADHKRTSEQVQGWTLNHSHKREGQSASTLINSVANVLCQVLDQVCTSRSINRLQACGQTSTSNAKNISTCRLNVREPKRHITTQR